MTNAIETRGSRSETCPSDVRALDGLSFAVPTGTIFGLLGPNGAGKSTAVKILSTLTRPDPGRPMWPASTCSPTRTAFAARSAWWGRSTAPTRRRRAVRTSPSRASSTALRGRELRARVTRSRCLA